jgi:hypothetical protein
VFVTDDERAAIHAGGLLPGGYFWRVTPRHFWHAIRVELRRRRRLGSRRVAGASFLVGVLTPEQAIEAGKQAVRERFAPNVTADLETYRGDYL